MGVLDSREFDRLKERGFKPYSKGHRAMYEKAIYGMKLRAYSTSLRSGGARVIEAGFGIGWGLGRMIEEGVLRSYVGYEPNQDSFDFVKGKYGEYQPGGPVDMLLLPLTFEPDLDPAFDFAVCIEVIEHVPGEEHLAFLKGLRHMAPVLYFSTPDIRRAPTEGVRTSDEWVALLGEAGFDKVAVDNSEWTTFYEAHR